MDGEGDVDERSRRFGRVVLFRVAFPDGAESNRDARRLRLKNAGYGADRDQLVRPGFTLPEVVGTALCSRYVQEEERQLEGLNGPQVQRELRYTNFYDLMGDDRRGYILVGGHDTAAAQQELARYLEAVGLEVDEVVAQPVSIPDEAMKGIFFDPRVTRKAFKAAGLTSVTLRTSLPELTRARYYQILEAEGIRDEPWQSCEFVPPAMPAAARAPPRVHLRTNGFTILSTYLHPGTWRYVRWLLDQIDRTGREEPGSRRRSPTLFDSYEQREAGKTKDSKRTT